ncbi:hypothetical protein AUK40_03160 [Candidatus Wirthbacteria bacterium CG2_30_54_11]|uniref:Cytidyltransferase-like domain-containing protein n=1 Tax=Candidatus Wirthbacteria bacterium CG2_30_54_11 TaxID=1817892 RepID=A0A1J5IKA1_9BACT|nr:MAG: hypothetical protein AUK40_03160 [Candidatus Wirthbacteria bacterium CG2_30_54_11]
MPTRPRTVLASGVFDLLHPGHVFYLNRSRELGDRLVVIVTCDEVARREKREPVVAEGDRLSIIRALRVVDEAWLGCTGDRYTLVSRLRPDIIALGHDQKEDEQTLAAELKNHGIEAAIVRIEKYTGSLASSSRMMHKVRTHAELTHH